jgi:hypothetical protein
MKEFKEIFKEYYVFDNKELNAAFNKFINVFLVFITLYVIIGLLIAIYELVISIC